MKKANERGSEIEFEFIFETFPLFCKKLLKQQKRGRGVDALGRRAAAQILHGAIKRPSEQNVSAAAANRSPTRGLNPPAGCGARMSHRGLN